MRFSVSCIFVKNFTDSNKKHLKLKTELTLIPRKTVKKHNSFGDVLFCTSRFLLPNDNKI